MAINVQPVSLGQSVNNVKQNSSNNNFEGQYLGNNPKLLEQYSAKFNGKLYQVRLLRQGNDLIYQFYCDGELKLSVDKVATVLDSKVADDNRFKFLGLKRNFPKIKNGLDENFSPLEVQKLEQMIDVVEILVLSSDIMKAYSISEQAGCYQVEQYTLTIFPLLSCGDDFKKLARKVFDVNESIRWNQKACDILEFALRAKDGSGIAQNINQIEWGNIREAYVIKRAFYLTKVSLAEVYLELGRFNDVFNILSQMEDLNIETLKKELVFDKNFSEADLIDLISRVAMVRLSAYKEILKSPKELEELRKRYQDPEIKVINDTLIALTLLSNFLSTQEATNKKLLEKLYLLKVSLAELYLAKNTEESLNNAVILLEEMAKTQVDSEIFGNLKEVLKDIEKTQRDDLFFRANMVLADALRAKARALGSKTEITDSEYNLIQNNYQNAEEIYKKLMEEFSDEEDFHHISARISLAETYLARGFSAITFNREEKKSPLEFYNEAEALISKNDYQTLKEWVINSFGGRPQDKDDLLNRAIFVKSDALKYQALKTESREKYLHSAELLKPLYNKLADSLKNSQEPSKKDVMDFFRAGAGLAESYLGAREFQKVDNFAFSKDKLELAEKFEDQNYFKTQQDLDVLCRFEIARADSLKLQALEKERGKIGSGKLLNWSAYTILAGLNQKISKIGITPPVKSKYTILVSQAEALQGAEAQNLALILLMKPDVSGNNLLNYLNEAWKTAGIYQREEFFNLYIRACLTQAYSYMKGGTVGLSKEERKDEKTASLASYRKGKEILEHAIKFLNENKKNNLFFTEEHKLYEALGDICVMSQNWTEAISAYQNAVKVIDEERKDRKQEKTILNFARFKIMLRLARAYGERNRPIQLTSPKEASVIQQEKLNSDALASLKIYQQINNEILSELVQLKKEGKQKTNEYENLALLSELVAREKSGREYIFKGENKKAVLSFRELDLKIKDLLRNSEEKYGDLVLPFRYQIYYDLASSYGRLREYDKQSRYLQLAHQFDERPRWTVREEARVRMQSLYFEQFENGNGFEFSDKYLYKPEGLSTQIIIDGQTYYANSNSSNIWVDYEIENNRIFTYSEKATVGEYLSFYLTETKDLKKGGQKFSSPALQNFVEQIPEEFLRMAGLYLEPVSSEIRESQGGGAQFENKNYLARVDVFFDKDGKFIGFGVTGTKKFEKWDAEAQAIYDALNKELEARFGGNFRLGKDRAVQLGAMTRQPREGNADYGIYGGVSYSFGKYKGVEITPYTGAGYYFNAGTGYLYTGVNFNKNQFDLSVGMNMAFQGEAGFTAVGRYQINPQLAVSFGGALYQNGYPSGFLMADYEHGEFLGLIDAFDFSAGLQVSPDKIGPVLGFALTKELNNQGPLNNSVLYANAGFSLFGPDGALVWEKNNPKSSMAFGVDGRSLLVASLSLKKDKEGLVIGLPLTQDFVGYHHLSKGRLSDVSYTVGLLKWFRVAENPLIYDRNLKHSEFFFGPSLLFGFIPVPFGIRKNPNPGEGSWHEDGSHSGFRNFSKGQSIEVLQTMVFDLTPEDKKILDSLESDLQVLEGAGVKLLFEKNISFDDANQIRAFQALIEEVKNSCIKPQTILIIKSGGINFQNGQLSVGANYLKKAGENNTLKLDSFKNEISDKLNKLLSLEISSSGNQSSIDIINKVSSDISNDVEFKKGLEILKVMLERSHFTLEGLKQVVIVDEKARNLAEKREKGVLFIKKSLITDLANPVKMSSAVRLIEEEFEKFDLVDVSLMKSEFKERLADKEVYNFIRQGKGIYRITGASLNEREEIVSFKDEFDLVLSWDNENEKIDNWGNKIKSLKINIVKNGIQYLNKEIILNVQILKISDDLLAKAVGLNQTDLEELKKELIKSGLITNDGFVGSAFSDIKNASQIREKLSNKFKEKAGIIFIILKQYDRFILENGNEESLITKYKELVKMIETVNGQKNTNLERELQDAEIEIFGAMLEDFFKNEKISFSAKIEKKEELPDNKPIKKENAIQPTKVEKVKSKKEKYIFQPLPQ